MKLKDVQTTSSTDYYMEVKSPAKALKKHDIKDLFETRYQQELQKIKGTLLRIDGVKKIRKVHEHIGVPKQNIHPYTTTTICN